MINNFRIAVLMVMTGWVLTSCAQISQVTYPERYVYLDRGSVQSTMHKFSSNLYEIGLLLENNTVLENPANAIYEKLESMENAASQLLSDRQATSAVGKKNNTTSYETNHLVLDENLDAFLTKITVAKLQVRATPPNYYQVGKMAGECSACHIHR